MLGELKAHIFKLVRAEEAYIGHFAKATVSFPTPLNWLGRFVVERDGDREQLVDIKKGGIFPIVHGVRSLALEYCLADTNTIARVQALSGRGPFSEEFTADLIEAFDFMSMLRLREQFGQIECGDVSSNLVDLDGLSNFERTMLRDCFKVVREFKSYIVDHFRLQLLM
jgi:CBS domain-containing protein